MKTPTLRSTNSTNRSPWTTFLLIIPLLLACFALSPQARAVCQQGCDPSNDNTFLGEDALINNTTGSGNTAVGFDALFSNTSGNGNTATGFDALFSNTAGTGNTAYGDGALSNNATGNENTATGEGALFFNTTGFDNAAYGFNALSNNTDGFFNTAIGADTLSNSNGSENTATGVSALEFNTTGSFNTATGFEALTINATGVNNTGTGAFALARNTTGHSNTAIGVQALQRNSNGNRNIALGFRAGDLISGSRNIDIGNEGLTGESNTIRIGTVGDQTATFIVGISGATVPTGVAVIVDSDGHLGTTTSSARFKEAIQPMDKASEAILALKPVTFRYRHELDPEGIPQFGLVAEDVEKVNPDLVARDDQGKPYSVRYEAVNAMLLNEFLKEHRTVHEQKEIIAQLRQDFARQQKQIEALTAGLQKVSAQLELSKSAPQAVLNDQ